MSAATFGQSFGQTAAVKIDGVDYSIGPIDLDAMLACVGEMQRIAGDPFASLMPRIRDLPEELAEKLFREALENHKTMSQANHLQGLAWTIDDPQGLWFLLWFLLNRAAPGRVSRETVTHYCVGLRLADPRKYADLIDQIGEMSGYKALSKDAAAAHRAVANLMQKRIGRSSSEDSQTLQSATHPVEDTPSTASAG